MQITVTGVTDTTYVTLNILKILIKLSRRKINYRNITMQVYNITSFLEIIYFLLLSGFQTWSEYELR